MHETIWLPPCPRSTIADLVWEIVNNIAWIKGASAAIGNFNVSSMSPLARKEYANERTATAREAKDAQIKARRNIIKQKYKMEELRASEAFARRIQPEINAELARLAIGNPKKKKYYVSWQAIRNDIRSILSEWKE